MYTIATIVSLAEENSDNMIGNILHQDEMRPHLIKILEFWDIVPFPVTKWRVQAKLLQIELCQIYCSWRLPDTRSTWFAGRLKISSAKINATPWEYVILHMPMYVACLLCKSRPADIWYQSIKFLSIKVSAQIFMIYIFLTLLTSTRKISCKLFWITAR